MLSAQDLSFAHGARVLFDNIQLSLDAAERVALVGHNGAGKSTLLSVLAKELPADAGAIHLFKNARLGILVQEPRLDLESTVVQIVESGLGAWNSALKAHKAACEQAERNPDDVKLHKTIGELTEKIDALGGFDIEHRVEEMLNRLSITAREEKINALSGGERRRVDLARLLLSAPDVLLLDEPTNHLDMEAIRFLGEVLKRHRGPVLFISHDRSFIDDVCTRILELNLGQIYTHTPPYENFLHGQLNRQDVEGRTLQKKKRMAARELAWLRTGPKARSTKQNARKDRAETLIDDLKDEVHLRRESQSRMRKNERRLAKTILEIKNLSLGIAGRTFFKDFDLTLVEGERWGIVGENGAGKSTLLKVLLKELKPLAGEVKWGGKSDVVFLDQHRKDLLPNTTLKEILTPDGGDYVYVGDEQIHICTYLENYMFDPSDRFRQVETLSGGERNRLLLARMLREDGNVLLLDEPTNDLDITTLGILEDVLHNHQGVALVVSHDRVFLDRVCTGILAFEPSSEDGVECKIQVQQGDFTHYERMRLERQKAEFETEAEAESKNSTAEAKLTSSSPKPKTNTGVRKKTYKEEQEYAGIEEKVMLLEEKKEEIDGILAEGSIFVSAPEKGAQLSQESAELTTRIEECYARWQILEELR